MKDKIWNVHIIHLVLNCRMRIYLFSCSPISLARDYRWVLCSEDAFTVKVLIQIFLDISAHFTARYNTINKNKRKKLNVRRCKPLRVQCNLPTTIVPNFKFRNLKLVKYKQSFHFKTKFFRSIIFRQWFKTD